jgi:hypothetical protein
LILTLIGINCWYFHAYKLLFILLSTFYETIFDTVEMIIDTLRPKTDTVGFSSKANSYNQLRIDIDLDWQQLSRLPYLLTILYLALYILWDQIWYCQDNYWHVETKNWHCWVFLNTQNLISIKTLSWPRLVTTVETSIPSYNSLSCSLHFMRPDLILSRQLLTCWDQKLTLSGFPQHPKPNIN